MKKILVGLIAIIVLLCGIGPAVAGPDDKGPVTLSAVMVPNVVGKTLVEAMRVLGAAGLRAQTQQSDRDGERRIVIRQSPSAGARVARGSFVNIYGQLAGDGKGRVNLPGR